MGFLPQALVFFAAAVFAVVIFKRLGLGSVLGYLVAGVVIGPFGLKVVHEVENVLHFAELGVVLLLFVIGLELEPERLWNLRKQVFGSGTAQVVATTVLLGATGMAFGLDARAAFVAGFGLAMSSTAFALQLLSERNEVATPHGRSAFAILLFQDLSVVPALAVLPLLSAAAGTGNTDPAWLVGLKAIGVIVGVIAASRYVVRPILRLVAGTHSQEAFTATTLFIAVGTALVVSKAGLSMALGAFLAGMLLADSDYRHELQADIEPFKGLLLGLFFMAVGMSLDVKLFIERPLLILGLVALLFVLKGLVLFVIGKVTCKANESGASLAAAIAQGGEFAFVLFSLGLAQGLLDKTTAGVLTVVVSVSMAISPLLFIAYARWMRPMLLGKGPKREFDVAPDEDAPVIIAGFGRVGQVVGRILRAKKIHFTAMDSNPEHIEFIKKFGNKVFFGDASRLDLLRAARAEKAKVFVLAIDDVEGSLRTAKTVMDHFPNLVIVARARNRQHAYRLYDMGIRHVFRETLLSSVDMTSDVLTELGYPLSEVKPSLDRFIEHDQALVLNQYMHHGNLEKLQELAANARLELESIFDADMKSLKGQKKTGS